MEAKFNYDAELSTDANIHALPHLRQPSLVEVEQELSKLSFCKDRVGV